MCSSEDLLRKVIPYKEYKTRKIGYKVFTKKYDDITGVYHKSKYEFGKEYWSKELNKFERDGMTTDLKIFGFSIFRSLEDAIVWGKMHCYFPLVIKVSYNNVMAEMKKKIVLAENMKLIRLVWSRESES